MRYRTYSATTAHLTDHVLPPLPLRHWVLAVPKRLCHFLRRVADLRGAALRLFLRVVAQWDHVDGFPVVGSVHRGR